MADSTAHRVAVLCYSPELHPVVDQSQRDEVLLAVLAVVEQDACHLRCSELHGDANRVVSAHGLEGQIGLATKGWDEILDHCGGMKTASQSCYCGIIGV